MSKPLIVLIGEDSPTLFPVPEHDWKIQVEKSLPDFEIYKTPTLSHDNKQQALEQLKDRYFKVQQAFITAFWFPASACSLSLVDLGLSLGNRTGELVVGCDINYKYMHEIVQYCRFYSYHTKMQTSLTHFIKEIYRITIKDKIEKERQSNEIDY